MALPLGKLFKDERFLSVVLAIGIVLFSMRASAFELLCNNAERFLCEDLLHLQTAVHRVGSVTLRRKCGTSGLEACSVIDLKAKTCDIYHQNRIEKSTWFHEMNHCRGWTHKEETRISYNSVWVPMLGRAQ